VAVASGVAGVGLLLLIRLAGSAAGRSRAVLLNTFKPGLYVTAMAVIALIAAQGGVAVATIWYTEATLVGRVHTGVILAIAAGALAGIVAVARGMFVVVRKAEVTVVGARIDRTREPAHQRIESLAQGLGPRPQHTSRPGPELLRDRGPRQVPQWRGHWPDALLLPAAGPDPHAP
jgi:hypothetical protein